MKSTITVEVQNKRTLVPELKSMDINSVILQPETRTLKQSLSGVNVETKVSDAQWTAIMNVAKECAVAHTEVMASHYETVADLNTRLAEEAAKAAEDK